MPRSNPPAVGMRPAAPSPPIPARKSDPEHLHYDVRYLLRTTGATDYVVSDESHDLRWVPLEEVPSLTTEDSMTRMVRKTPDL